MRKEYLRMVTETFEAAQGHAELICAYEGFEPMIERMRVGEEYDQMVVDIINVRYRAFHERVDESRAWVEKIKDEWQRRDQF